MEVVLALFTPRVDVLRALCVYRYRAAIVALNALGPSRATGAVAVGFDVVPTQFTFATATEASPQLVQATSIGSRPYVAQPMSTNATAASSEADSREWQWDQRSPYLGVCLGVAGWAST
jgi:hypothetical protein